MGKIGTVLPPDFELEGKVKVNEWLAKLHKVGWAGDELLEQRASARQLIFDLDSAYSALTASLWLVRKDV
jgi:ESCRT-I complex subunit VPS28